MCQDNVLKLVVEISKCSEIQEVFMRKTIDKFIDLTSLVEIDENGVEHKKPWTLEEFITGQILMSIGGIIGAIFF